MEELREKLKQANTSQQETEAKREAALENISQVKKSQVLNDVMFEWCFCPSKATSEELKSILVLMIHTEIPPSLAVLQGKVIAASFQKKLLWDMTSQNLHLSHFH